MDIIEWCERGRVPDFLARWGMRRLIRRRLRQETSGSDAQMNARLQTFIRGMKSGPIAVNTADANTQHYEVPTEFFERTLGPRLKYSACLFPTANTQLAEAEEHMLRLTCERAELANGQRILELGCGWGSLALWMAEQYPQSHISAVSNSATQRIYIEQQAAERSLHNLTVTTADMNDFDTQQSFDRVVSVEMFEHMRNYQQLLKNVAGWLTPEGKLFVHMFCHRTVSYAFEGNSQEDWMARYFFTGGIMPCWDTFAYFQDDLGLEQRWEISGRHYAKTLNAWLSEQDRQREQILEMFAEAYGEDNAAIWFQRWRMFFMACAEFFAMNRGKEWFVGHFLLSGHALHSLAHD